MAPEQTADGTQYCAACGREITLAQDIVYVAGTAEVRHTDEGHREFDAQQLTIVTTYWDGVTERETFDAQFVLEHFEELAWYANAEGGDYVKRTGNLLRIGRYTDKWQIVVIEPANEAQS